MTRMFGAEMPTVALNTQLRLFPATGSVILLR